MSSLSQEITRKLETFRWHLQRRRFSDNTITTYLSLLKVFFSFANLQSLKEIQTQDIIAFNDNYILAKEYSRSYQNQFTSALKALCRFYQLKGVDFKFLERPRSSTYLPVVLSTEEVQLILSQIRNQKHLAVLAIIYACGLRVGEAVTLRLSDIDSSRMVVHIHSAKGNKDRPT